NQRQEKFSPRYPTPDWHFQPNMRQLKFTLGWQLPNKNNRTIKIPTVVNKPLFMVKNIPDKS
ncbi:MAG: hypothetical protein AAFQ41_11270, partial [Cyanobacteria bacterium J06623_7]